MRTEPALKTWFLLPFEIGQLPISGLSIYTNPRSTHEFN